MSEEFGVKGKRVAFLGNISHKKGPMLLLHACKAIYDYDNEFTFHIGGAMQDSRFALYFDIAIPELGLSDAIHYYGFIEDSMKWMEDKDFLLVTSPLEGMPVGVLEGLQCGLTPLIYSFVGAKGLYPPDFIWITLNDLVEIVKGGPREPQIFKDFIKENYSKKIQFEKLDKIVEDLLRDVNTKPEIKKNSSVAAILAVKNGEKTIKRALDSLLKQTKPLEKIIIVDDASTDGTMKLLQEFKDKSDIPVQIIPNTVSKWVFSARNQGFWSCSSDYFFFLDHDDWVDPQYSEELSKVLDQNSAVSVAYSDMLYFDDKDNEKRFNQPEFSAQALSQYNFVAYSSMQRTKSFKEMGGFSDYMNDCRNHLTEWDLWLRYIKAGHGFKRLSQPLFHYFHDDDTDQMSSGYERSRDDMSLELALNISEDHSEIQMTGEKKRIVLVCQGKDYLDHSQVGFELMTIYKPLEEFGDVFVFQYDVEMEHFGKNAMQKRLKDFLDLIKPDYVFHFTYKSDILPATWKDISKKYVTICWGSDDDRRYEDFTKGYGEHFCYQISTYPSIYDRMEHPGRILSQWAANQYYFKPLFDRKLLCSNMPADKTIAVSFVGQNHTNRSEMLTDPIIDCYGLGWPNGFVSFKEVGEIMAKSKISLSLSMGVKGRQLKLRPFEITASNALCICEQMPGIENYFVPDKEIVLFDTKEEMEEKIKYYLDHYDERKTIAAAGYARTIKDHLWSNRLKAIFEEVDK